MELNDTLDYAKVEYAILQKFEISAEWDHWLPFLLFAYEKSHKTVQGSLLSSYCTDTRLGVQWMS